MSLSATATLVDVTPAFPAFSGGLTVGTIGDVSPYHVLVVDHEGTVLKVLALASVGDITDTLNAASEWDIRFPKHAYTTADVDLIGNADGPMEIQIFKGGELNGDETDIVGGQLVAWGPAVTDGGAGSSGSEDVTLHCSDPMWYFPRRFLDAELDNILINGNFPNFGSWNTSGSTSGGPGGGTIGDGVTATLEADVFEVGKNAVVLTSFVAPTGLGVTSDPMLFTALSHGNDVLLKFSLEVDEFDVETIFGSGVLFIGSPPGGDGSVVGGVNAKGAALYKIDGTTPRKTKIRGSLKLHVPPKKTWALQVWLFGFNTGVVKFGQLSVEPQRSLSTADFTGSPTAPAVDVNRIVRMIDDYGLTANHSNGKSDLNIGVNAPATGVRMFRKYNFADHIAVDQALAELNDRRDCFDHSIVCTRHTRVHTIYPITDGGRGVDRSADITLTYGEPPFASYSPGIDGGATASQITMLGDGGGDVREEAWSTDAAAIGGVVLQANMTAPAGAAMESLGPRADAEIDRAKKPARIFTVVLTREPYGDDGLVLPDILGVGDRVGLDIADGWYSATGTWRIVQRIRHTKAETVAVVLNEVIA